MKTLESPALNFADSERLHNRTFQNLFFIQSDQPTQKRVCTHYSSILVGKGNQVQIPYFFMFLSNLCFSLFTDVWKRLCHNGTWSRLPVPGLILFPSFFNF